MKTMPCSIPPMRTPSSVVSVTYLRNIPMSSSVQVIASAVATAKNRRRGEGRVMDPMVADRASIPEIAPIFTVPEAPVLSPVEDSHSGLVRTIGNRVGDETPRGFKSRILRQCPGPRHRAHGVAAQDFCARVAGVGVCE